ncbi:MAG: class I SAM-dependent methyltransferase [Thermoplasmata archaeon]
MENKDKFERISAAMREHYTRTFSEFGATYRGVDWGSQESTFLRYEKMLAVIDERIVSSNMPVSLLDVGCGYGGLFQYSKEKNLVLEYTGIDVSSNMILWAREHIPDAEFIEGDFLEYDFNERKFDYVVCNGILTQKLNISILDMDKFARQLIKKMFSLCKRGIAFNIMTTYVNYFAPNLYYKHPSEMLTYCLSEISQKVKLDHSYGLYEYTVYIYR